MAVEMLYTQFLPNFGTTAFPTNFNKLNLRSTKEEIYKSAEKYQDEEKRRFIHTSKHSQFSSLWERISASIDEYGNYRCVTCEVNYHSANLGYRRGVLLSSSLLHKWFQTRGQRDKVHVDLISIENGTLQELYQLYMDQYKTQQGENDVLLVGGLQEILLDMSNIEIISLLNRFRSNIATLQSEKIFTGTSHHSTFAVATLPSPPNFNEAQFKQLKLLNEEIQKFNQSMYQGVLVTHAPKFHSWGVGTKRTKKDPLQNFRRKKVPKIKNWNIDQNSMVENLKRKMAQSCNTYFKQLWAVDQKDRENSKQADTALLFNYFN